MQEDLDLHRKVRAARGVSKVRASAARAASRDAGNIAVIEDDGAIIGQRNPFNLTGQQVRFVPVNEKYRFETSSGGYDEALAIAGTRLVGLGDDDARRIALPFAFPFYGSSYTSVWVNSDGNLTFIESDTAISGRSIGRFNAGPPRIAALFSDLNPAASVEGVRVLSEAQRVTISWRQVPEFVESGISRLQTFQIRLYPDGGIEIAFSSIAVDEAVSGIGPGSLQGHMTLVSFLNDQSAEYDGMLVERFGSSQELDIVTAAQRFYETHEDAYDYLAFFNNAGLQAGSGVLAYESTVRSNRQGIGDTPIDVGAELGSPGRLQAVLNFGTLSNYPLDPNATVPARGSIGDTPLTVLGHESGHLFLALVSVRTPGDSTARPMLGQQLAHWNFRFNSDASLLEGNRIRDNGESATPRFTTTATVQGYSALDQYLMGLRAPEDVPDTFLVENSNLSNSVVSPRVGVSFDGTRRNVAVNELISLYGRRVPDHTVEQRRYRMAFILITPQGQTATQSQIDQLEVYRAALETTWSNFAGGRAAMETSLRKSIRLSAEPAQGAIVGGSVPVLVSLGATSATPTTVALRVANGLLQGPASITIAPGEKQASAFFTAIAPGVETLTAEAGSDFIAPEARISIASGASAATVQIVSGNRQTGALGQLLPQPVVVKVTDANALAYPGVIIIAQPTEGGSVSPASVVTDSSGRAGFNWTLSTGALNLLRFRIEGTTAVQAEAIALSRPTATAAGVTNAASFQTGISPGGIATVFGSSLAGVQLMVNGVQSTVFYSNDFQANFLVPDSIAAGTATLSLQTGLGSNTVTGVPVNVLQPGIFFDAATSRAAAIDRGSRIFEVYGTGFGPVNTSGGLSTTATPVTAQVAGVSASVLYSGLAPGFPGLYQFNVQVPAGVPAGDQVLKLFAGAIASNEVRLPVAP